MAEQRFRAEVRSAGRTGGHLVEVPAKVVSALGGGGRIPVRATFNGLPYRGSVVHMGGVTCIGVLKSIVEQAEIAVGDRVDVVLERDDAPREVEVPAELETAINDANVESAWGALSFTRRKEYARSVAEAKRPETREERIQRILSDLRKRAGTS